MTNTGIPAMVSLAWRSEGDHPEHFDAVRPHSSLGYLTLINGTPGKATGRGAADRLSAMRKKSLFGK